MLLAKTRGSRLLFMRQLESRQSLLLMPWVHRLMPTMPECLPKRSRIQTRFINGDIGIIVATVAFGMGIDKSITTGLHDEPIDSRGLLSRNCRAGRSKLSRYFDAFFADQKRMNFSTRKLSGIADLGGRTDKIPKDGRT